MPNNSISGQPGTARKISGQNISRRWNFAPQEKMKKLFISLTFAATCAFAQLAAPTLEEIKIAADAGDPAAQDKLAERFIMRADTKQAEIWYRKSAAQGYAHAQGQLGNMLLMRSRMSYGVKPEDRAIMTNEALQWMTIAGNQGDRQGQANLADIYLEGKLVKQDFIEAYKWGDLSAQGTAIYNVAGISGRSTRDSAILKMDADQIAEARRRVAAFSPHTVKKSDLPEPGWVKKIKLGGINGTPAKRLATIANQTYEKGERKTLKIDGQPITIQCLEITDSSATVSIEGIDGTRTLNLN